MKTLRSLACLIYVLIGVALAASPGQPCARVLWSHPDRAVVVGRSMNWPEDPQTSLWAFPRGIKRDGRAGNDSVTWVAKYGSVTAGFYDFATADGVNEKGLAVSVLWLDEADYGPRDGAVPALSTSLWGQFYLDNYATVAEAVRATRATPFRLVPINDGREASRLHLAVADPTGDSAIIEYVRGAARVYHARDYAVMTNSPPLPDQLKNLKRYQGFGGTRRLPASATQSADRFVLASSHLAAMRHPETARGAVADMFALLRAVSTPPGVPGTRWRAVADLTNKVYFFESVTGPNVVWARLDRFAFAPGNPVLKLDLAGDPELAGEAFGKFQKAEAFTFAAAD